MSLTNSVRKYIDEVMGIIKNHIISPLLCQELFELDQYVAIYSLNRRIHECIMFVWKPCLVSVSPEVIINYFVLIRDTYNGLRYNHTPLIIR